MNFEFLLSLKFKFQIFLGLNFAKLDYLYSPLPLLHFFMIFEPLAASFEWEKEISEKNLWKKYKTACKTAGR